MTAEPTFFASVAEWRAWLAANHATSDGLEVGLIKKAAVSRHHARGSR